MSSAVAEDFKFGVEIEVCIKGQKKKKTLFKKEKIRKFTQNEWDNLAAKLCKHLDQAGIACFPNGEYTEWGLHNERDITKQSPEDGCGMELVSPIYEFRDPDTWESKLQLVWEVLKNGFETSTNDDCSTHVHISPAGQDTAFTLGQAKKIAKAVVYYERCVDSIMPDKRRVKLYCRSNRYTSAFDGKEMPEVFEMIDAIPSTEKLALLMNIYKEPGMFLKFFRWNFENLRPGMKGTIEFRQPPGSVDDQDSRFWILFTRAYVHAAMLYGDKIDPAKPVQDLRVFRDFILDGAKDAGMSVRNQATLAKPFEEKALFPEVRFKLTNEDEDSVEYKAEMESLAREENLSFDEVKYRYSTYTTSAAQYN